MVGRLVGWRDAGRSEDGASRNPGDRGEGFVWALSRVRGIPCIVVEQLRSLGFAYLTLRREKETWEKMGSYTDRLIAYVVGWRQTDSRKT